MNETFRDFYVIDKFGCFRRKRNSFVQISGYEEKSSNVGVEKALVYFKVSVRESVKSQENAFLQYMEVMCSIYPVHNTHEFVCLR